jgi:hypothetical protein
MTNPYRDKAQPAEEARWAKVAGLLGAAVHPAKGAAEPVGSA